MQKEKNHRIYFNKIIKKIIELKKCKIIINQDKNYNFLKKKLKKN